MKTEQFPSGCGVISVAYEPGVDPELLPCPFCGKTEAEVLNTHTASYWVECSCGAEIHGKPGIGRSFAAHRRAFMSAVLAWNGRNALASEQP